MPSTGVPPKLILRLGRGFEAQEGCDFEGGSGRDFEGGLSLILRLEFDIEGGFILQGLRFRV